MLGKYLFKSYVSKLAKSNMKLDLLVKMTAKHPTKVVLLIRCSPGIPFVVSNYTFGVTKIKFRHYAVGFLPILSGSIVLSMIQN